MFVSLSKTLKNKNKIKMFLLLFLMKESSVFSHTCKAAFETFLSSVTQQSCILKYYVTKAAFETILSSVMLQGCIWNNAVMSNATKLHLKLFC